MCDNLTNVFNKYIMCIFCINIENDDDNNYHPNYIKRNSIEDDYVIIEKIN
jgi:hypothetical protein